MKETYIKIRIDKQTKSDFKKLVGEKGMTTFIIDAIKKRIKRGLK